MRISRILFSGRAGYEEMHGKVPGILTGMVVVFR
jgi:hypothetical protein